MFTTPLNLGLVITPLVFATGLSSECIPSPEHWQDSGLGSARSGGDASARRGLGRPLSLCGRSPDPSWRRGCHGRGGHAGVELEFLESDARPERHREPARALGLRHERPSAAALRSANPDPPHHDAGALSAPLPLSRLTAESAWTPLTSKLLSLTKPLVYADQPRGQRLPPLQVALGQADQDALVKNEGTTDWLGRGLGGRAPIGASSTILLLSPHVLSDHHGRPIVA